MTNKNFKFNVDFLLQFAADKTKIESIAKETKKILEKNHPEIALELNEDDIKKELNSIVDTAKKLQDAFDNVEMGGNLINDFDKLQSAFNNLDISDLENLIDVLYNLDDDQLEIFNNLLEQMGNNIGGLSTSEIDKLANSFDQISIESKSFLESQKKALAMMELTGKKGTDEYKKLKEEIDKTESEVKKLDDAFGLINKSTESFTDKLSKFEAIGQVASMMEEFAQSSIQTRDALLNLQGRTGATGDELIRLNQLAEQAFLRGVGGSVAEAVNAIGVAKQSLGNFLDEKELLDFTNAAAGIAQVFDKDINEVINGSRTFIGQFGLEGKEAADLVAFAMQKSGSKMDDTLDTLDEYSQLVVKAGFDAKEFVGIVSTGMDMNVRDTDKLADAIKETQIRLNAGDTSKAIAEMSSPVTETIQEIVRLGEEGQLSIKEVLQQSNQVLKEAYNSGTITAALRDQFAVALSGTMAEDIGGELYTKIFSTKVDTKVISDQAKRAGEDISNALGPVTDFESLQRKIDLFANNLGNVFAPFIAGAGGALSSISQVAPALSLMQNMNFSKLAEGASKVKDLALTVGTKLTGALQTADAGQKALNLTMLANPAVAITASIAALVVGLKILSEWLDFTAAEQKQQTEEQLKVIDVQIETTKSQKQLIKSNLDLVNSFKEQGKSAMENEDLLLNLAGAYPGVIDGSKSYEENLSNLNKAAGKSSEALGKVDADLQNLASKKFELETKILKLEFDVASENLTNDITDSLNSMDLGDWGSIVGGVLTFGYSFAVDPNGMDSLEKAVSNIGEFFNVGSIGRNSANDLIGEFVNGMDKATSSNQIKQIGINMKLAIINNSEISEEDKTKLLKGVDDLEISKQKQLEATTNAIQNQYNSYKESGLDEKQIISMITKEHGKTEDQIKDIIKGQKEHTDQVAKTADEVKKLSSSYADVKKAASEAFSSEQAKELNLRLEIMQAEKQGNKELAKQKKEELSDQIRIVNSKKGELSQLERIEKLANSRFETGRSFIEILNENLKINDETLNYENERFTLQEETNRIMQNRSKTLEDDYKQSLNNLAIEQKKLDFLKEQLKEKGKTIDGKFVISDNVKNKEDLEKILEGYQNQFQKSKNSTLQLKIELRQNVKDLEDSILNINQEFKNLSLAKINAEIEFTNDPNLYDDLIKYYKDLNSQMLKDSEINNDAILYYEELMNEELLKLKGSNNQEEINLTKMKYLKEIEELKSANLKVLNEVEGTSDKIIDITQSQLDLKLSIIDEQYAKEKLKIEANYKLHSDLVDSLNKKYGELYTNNMSSSEDSILIGLDDELKRKINMLDQYSNTELGQFTNTENEKIKLEEEYNNKKLQIQKEFSEKRRMFNSFQNGVALENERIFNLEKNRLDLKQINDQIEAYKKLEDEGKLTIKDKKALEDLEISRQEITQQINDNSDSFVTALRSGKDEFANIFTELFAGSGDNAANALKEYFAKVFGVMAEALAKYINGVVLDLTLKWLSLKPGDPIASLLLAPVIYSVISGAVNAFAQPIIEGLTSFSTGGEINSPQLAIVGDASKLGSENKEWIFRNDQLKQVINMATNNSNNELLQEIRSLREILSSQEIQTRLSGQDILLSLKRTQYNLQSRKI